MSRLVSALAALGFAFLAPVALAQDGPASQPAPDAIPEVIDVMTLMAPGPLPDKALGHADAPVTVIEYASLTCSHCGNFYRTTFQPFKEKYVDTGKVRFILREFPLDQLALAAAAVARCVPEDKYFDVIHTMFEDQAKWAYVEQPGAALIELMKPYGMTEESINACVADKTLVEGIVATLRTASEKFGVQGTPAFFINGKRHGGEMTLAEFDAEIEPLLPKSN